MDSYQIRDNYIKFFTDRGHKKIPSAPLVPEYDLTTLFVSSGMQPLLPYLLGEKHPLGNRLVDVQNCIRTTDIDEVGDNRHLTYFEMLGNWSLGDYFKKEQLTYLFEFLTQVLKLDPNKLYVTVFSGSDKYHIPKDEESIKIWQELFAEVEIGAKEVIFQTTKNAAQTGMQGGRIFAYGVDKNWWSRFNSPEDMPVGEPGGPDSEVFFDFGTEHDPKYGEFCHPNCDCGRFLEIGNSVFMQYQKTDRGDFTPLPQKNVDFGGGLERLMAAVQNNPDIYQTDLFASIISKIEEYTKKSYSADEYKTTMRIIADHVKAAVFLIKSGVLPSNKARGYVLRRLLRRSLVKIYSLGADITSIQGYTELIDTVLQIYDGVHDINRVEDQEEIKRVAIDEINKFSKTVVKGLKELERSLRVIQKSPEQAGKIAFDLYQTYGLPVELTSEILQEHGVKINMEEFMQAFYKHQELSRTTSAGMFKGGLGDQSQESTKLHTATHLLQASLRKVLGAHVRQHGSHITPERLRFDFSHPDKLTPEQLEKIEEIVNGLISKDLPVSYQVMSKDEALQSGALGFFGEKYADQVKVYSIGNFSKEICGGPHVEHTGQLGHFKIMKEESAGSGIRRIYATVTT